MAAKAQTRESLLRRRDGSDEPLLIDRRDGAILRCIDGHIQHLRVDPAHLDEVVEALRSGVDPFDIDEADVMSIPTVLITGIDRFAHRYLRIHYNDEGTSASYTLALPLEDRAFLRRRARARALTEALVRHVGRPERRETPKPLESTELPERSPIAILRADWDLLLAFALVPVAVILLMGILPTTVDQRTARSLIKLGALGAFLLASHLAFRASLAPPDSEARVFANSAQS